MRRKALFGAFVFIVLSRHLHAQAPVTFDKEVVRIFQEHCQSCHRPGNIAPFSLLTYDESRRHAFEIQKAVVSHEMPPWKPMDSHGVFQDERYLSDDEIQTISKWIGDGVLEGDPADLPPPLTFPETWSKGDPDLVLQYSDAYTIPEGD